MFLQRLLFLAILNGFACACSSSSGVKADLGKLRSWSSDLERAQPLPLPYVVDFESGAKSLHYVAIEHSNEVSGPSISLLRRVMDARRFSVVVLEGFSRSLGFSPRIVKEEAEKDAQGEKSGFYRNGESTAAVLTALQKKIPFVGAEPEETQIKEAISAAGYTMEDLFGLYVVRSVPQWRRDGTLTRETIEETFARARPEFIERLGMKAEQAPNYEGFLRWYERKNLRPFRVREVRAETTAPFYEGALFTQRLAAVANQVRNVHILRVTEEMLNRYGRVLLVFSAGHFPVQRLALESMLGKPVRISDQP